MTILQIGRRLNRPAYTLIELVLLTVIILILVGISTPLFRRSFSHLQLEDASFNFARLVNFAQERAVIESLPYRLVLDLDHSRYFLTKPDPEVKDKYIRLKERWGRTFSLPIGVKLKADKKEIIFYPDGHSDKASISFTGKDKSLKINVKGNLGYVDME